MQGILWGGVIAAGLAAASLPTGSLMADDTEAMIETLRAATQRFEDVKVALAEGYVPDPSGECVSAAAHGLPAELGAMGIHYLRPDLLGITVTEPRVDGTGTHTDFMSPAILLYEPQEDGSLMLVGIENLVFRQAWEAAGHTEPPTLAGRRWDYMVDDPDTPEEEAHHFQPHYDQHVWFRENLKGNLEPFNPSVTCRYHTA
ncbi:hypothetical protein BOX17_13655 [Halomonas aestuarii]|uniref:Uncharacterized protein n=1 Tax=Halomonas aestuarii TaxID=1897729 RepID=A0A1J0VIP7_9GAMM|nr:hypothetical protein [Halomonas aestuarii]APE31907.1 hypothetical protein BOX17_13655 [Halomonas aestuarii]